MSAAVDPSELRLIRGFQAKDGDAKSTNVEMVELDNAIRLTTNGDAHVFEAVLGGIALGRNVLRAGQVREIVATREHERVDVQVAHVPDRVHVRSVAFSGERQSEISSPDRRDV